MASQIFSNQYTTANQPIRNLRVRISLLDFNFFAVNNIEGNVLDGSVSINANSNIRRTASLSFVVTDSSFDVKAGGQVWLDKYVKIEIGVDDIRTEEVVWNNLGIFLINQPTYNYDETNKQVSFKCVDLMAKMTGERNGYITGIGSEGFVLIPVGSNVREAIIDILKNCGFNEYYVSECINDDGTEQPVPYDMKFDQGTTWYEVLEKLKDIIPNYQIYFDINGVFRYEKIPSGETDPIMITDDLFKNNVTQEVVNVNFNDVKNVVEVWGRVHETDFFSDSNSTTIVNNVIAPTWTGLNEFTDYMITALSLSNAVASSNGIYIDFLNRMLWIKDSNGDKITSLPADDYLVFSYDPDGYWLFLGGAQAHAIWKDDNPDSPFYIGSTIGEIPIVLEGEDYDNIVSDDLALQRAKYEIYRRCRLNDTIDLTTIPIYWADVNWKVSYTPLSGGNITNEYMVQSLNIPLNVTGAQNWNLSRFYPFYPII